MRRYIIFIIALMLISLASFAQGQQPQHLKFLDIPITGKYQAMIPKLKAKGFVMDKTGSRGFQMHGRFSGRTALIQVFFTPKSKIVWQVEVFFDKTDWRELSMQYDEYKKTLIKKYGEPESHYEEFDYPYDKDDGMQETAIKNGKCNYSSYFEVPNGLIALEISKSCRLQISYEDSINRELKRKEVEEEQMDDL